MDSIFKFIDEMIFPLMVVLVASVMLVIFIGIMSDSTKRKGKAKDSLFQLLEKALIDIGSIDLQYIVNLKSSVERQQLVEVPMTHLLQDLLVRINLPDSSFPKDKLNWANEHVQSLIVEDNQKAPYENLPEEERRLFKGLQDAIRHSDNDSIRFHLDELNSVLVVRHKIYAKADKLNKWSVPLAIVGLVLTIIFGVAGMIGATKPDDLKKAAKAAVEENMQLLQNKVGSAPRKNW